MSFDHKLFGFKLDFNHFHLCPSLKIEYKVRSHEDRDVSVYNIKSESLLKQIHSLINTLICCKYGCNNIEHQNAKTLLSMIYTTGCKMEW